LGLRGRCPPALRGRGFGVGLGWAAPAEPTKPNRTRRPTGPGHWISNLEPACLDLVRASPDSLFQSINQIQDHDPPPPHP
jgi:hypothetical protein